MTMHLRRLHDSKSKSPNQRDESPEPDEKSINVESNTEAKINDDDDEELLVSTEPIIAEVDSAPSVDIDAQVAGRKFTDLASHPFEGSLLKIASKPGLRKKDLEAYLSKRWGTNMITAMFDPEVAAWTYFLYSIVLPHKSALDIAEAVQIQIKNEAESRSEFDLLGNLVGRKIKDSSDVANVARGLVRRAPVLLDYMTSFMRSK